jgi:zinc and cadmium transporter
MSTPVLLAGYCLLVVLGSLAGGWIPLQVRLTHTRMQLALSFVGGAMLGVGLLHLLPHAFYQLHSIHRAVGWLLAGFLLVFFIERVFHFHHHDPAVEDDDHDHDHAHHAHAHSRPWSAALVGLSLHSLLDGIALAAGVAGEPQEGAPALAGFVVFLVVVLHKPFDSMTLGALLSLSHLPVRRRHTINLVYAMTVPLGVLLFYLGVTNAGASQQTIIGCALAFAGGTFLCISTSDLLPELQFHTHDPWKLSAALLLGIGFSAALVAVEESWHTHSHGEHAVDVDHDHDAHGHAGEHAH